jgi:hypothetical protein
MVVQEVTQAACGLESGEVRVEVEPVVKVPLHSIDDASRLAAV